MRAPPCSSGVPRHAHICCRTRHARERNVAPAGLRMFRSSAPRCPPFRRAPFATAVEGADDRAGRAVQIYNVRSESAHPFIYTAMMGCQSVRSLCAICRQAKIMLCMKPFTGVSPVLFLQYPYPSNHESNRELSDKEHVSTWGGSTEGIQKRERVYKRKTAIGVPREVPRSQQRET